MQQPEKCNEGLSPYLLAERLDSEILQAEIPTEQDAAQNTSAHFWGTMEQFLADDTPEELLDARIEQSFFEANRIVDDGDTLSCKLQAQMFLANLNLLALRGHGRSIEAADIKQSYHMMANVLADTIDQYGKKEARTHITEMMTYALIARQGDTMNVPFVASVREEDSPWPRQNHRLYTVDDNVTIKTALRVQPEQRDSHTEPPESFVYTHNSERFFASNTYSMKSLQELNRLHPTKMNNLLIAELIINEPDEGYAADSLEADVLTTLSQRLIASLNAHRMLLLGLVTLSKAGRVITDVVAAAPRPKSMVVPRRVNVPHKAFFMKHHGDVFINPYVQAEHIPPEVLEQQSTSDEDRNTGPLWRIIELGLATNDTKSIINAVQEAQNIANDQTQQSTSRIGAAMINASGTLLAQRITATRTKPADILQSFHAMADILRLMRENKYGPLGLDHYDGLRAEIVSYCLVAYAANNRYIPYLGSPREEHSLLAIANHDMYTLPDQANASKIAAQIKHTFHGKRRQQLGTPADPRHTFLFPIYTRDVLQQQATNMDITSKRRKALDEAARLIVRASQNIISDHETTQLEGFSKAILKLFVDHREYLKANIKFHKMPYTTTEKSRDYVAGL